MSDAILWDGYAFSSIESWGLHKDLDLDRVLVFISWVLVSVLVVGFMERLFGWWERDVKRLGDMTT